MSCDHTSLILTDETRAIVIEERALLVDATNTTSVVEQLHRLNRAQAHLILLCGPVIDAFERLDSVRRYEVLPEISFKRPADPLPERRRTRMDIAALFPRRSFPQIWRGRTSHAAAKMDGRRARRTRYMADIRNGR